MTDIEKEIERLASDPEAKPAPEWVLEMRRECPAFIIPAALLLARDPQSVDDDTRRMLQASVMLGCADRVAAADLADLAQSGWRDFYPMAAREPQASTADTIDSFLERYCKPNPEEDALIEKLIFNPVAADYIGAPDEELPADYDISSLGNPAPAPDPAEEEEAKLPADARVEAGGDENGLDDAERDEPLLMESLAKIYVKQRRYERAFEIISKLSLNYPEKSVYFADQLRYLQKLIAISRAKSKA